ncbi:hypothetical protein N7533_007779 [Penicillium manginii]|uniref:uncharacterized protein n=1 Tax=Penicillium manginii TaxID=203109 RepID=UPI0025469BC2|nr:uncharacterized protein N7533_007779 [Penicillium manginii]KAJ5750751.1 hypothetical protein N7533_007779 [Penicillium manginii]
MATERYRLTDVLAVAKVHPFYNPDAVYPADAEAIQGLQELTDQNTNTTLQQQPFLNKKILYKVIERLVHDTDPLNTYRRSSYMSITGGGSGGIPMMFAVDVHENRRQRAQMGDFLKICGVVGPGDWVLSIHLAGGFYRSLDLTTEIMENAGATVLSAGSYMPPTEVAKYLAEFHVNVLTGEGAQVVQIIYHISMLPGNYRNRINLEKIIYTSEPLTSPQRVFIQSILGDVKIFSILGSSEAGPWAINSPDLTGEHGLTGSSTDFVFDTRSMLIEIISPSNVDDAAQSDQTLAPQTKPGLVVQTSLQRLRNPLVRYNTGDIGSVHPLPDTASAIVPEADRKHLRVLRMNGRDHRFSFKWYGCYFEFDKIESFMQANEFGILQWQIILDKLATTPQATLEVRLLRRPQAGVISDEDVIDRVRAFFIVFPENEHLVRIVFVDDLEGFERSVTARKIIKFVDRWNH